MPSLCNKRGRMRWRANVMVAGRTKFKWFPDDSRASEKKAIVWEKQAKKELEDEIKNAPQEPLEIQSDPEETTATDSAVEEKDDRVRVIEWLNGCLDRYERTKAGATYVEKKAVFKRFVEFVGRDLPVERLAFQEDGKMSLALVLDYFDHQFETRSGNGANKDRKNLRKAWMDGKRYVPGFPVAIANPFAEVERYPEVRFPRYVPPAEDFWAVFDLVDGQDRVMLLAFLHLAARRGEIFTSGSKPGLLVDDIDFSGRRIRLWTRKRQGGDLEADWLPMTQELHDQLKWWLDERPLKESPYVFYVLDIGDAGESKHLGEPFKFRQKFMAHWCRRAGVKAFGFHAIRHFTARHLHEKGYPVTFIQRVLRHRSAATTERYLATLGVETIRKVVDEGMPRFMPEQPKDTASRETYFQ